MRRPRAKRRSGGTVAPKYRNPANAEQTWSGRGKRPRWFNDALKAGKVVYDGPASGLERKQLIDIYGPEFEDVFWEGAPQ